MARVLLIVGGGIAAYKSLELVRLLKKAGHQVTPVLTKSGEHFVTAMSLGTLAESRVYSSLWELKDEIEIGHIQLSRAADFILVCPATADLVAKMAAGLADDLATTLLLATDKPVVVAPAMNVRMWQHAATQRNIEQLKADGVRVIDPAEGEMACGEYGPGRLPEPSIGSQQILPDALRPRGRAAYGMVEGDRRRILIFLSPPPPPPPLPPRDAHRQAHPRHCRADPRADRSGAGDRQPLVRPSGVRDRRGGGRSRRTGDLVAGPVALETPAGVDRVMSRPPGRWPTPSWRRSRPMPRSWSPPSPTGGSSLADQAQEGRGPAAARIPADPRHPRRTERSAAAPAPPGRLRRRNRPRGRAGRRQAQAKSADWIVANDVSGDVMGGQRNRVHLITGDGVEDWPEDKEEVAQH